GVGGQGAGPATRVVEPTEDLVPRPLRSTPGFVAEVRLDVVLRCDILAVIERVLAVLGIEALQVLLDVGEVVHHLLGGFGLLSLGLFLFLSHHLPPFCFSRSRFFISWNSRKLMGPFFSVFLSPSISAFASAVIFLALWVIFGRFSGV